MTLDTTDFGEVPDNCEIFVYHSAGSASTSIHITLLHCVKRKTTMSRHYREVTRLTLAPPTKAGIFVASA